MLRPSIGFYTPSIVTPPSSDLLLDLYPNAYFAYSTKKLRSGYNGACLRVRITSSGLESDIGFGIDGWLNEAELNAFVGANAFTVTTLYDQGLNGFNAAQSTPSGQSSLTTSGIDGKPAIVCTGNGRRYNILPTSPAFGNVSRIWGFFKAQRVQTNTLNQALFYCSIPASGSVRSRFEVRSNVVGNVIRRLDTDTLINTSSGTFTTTTPTNFTYLVDHTVAKVYAWSDDTERINTATGKGTGTTSDTNSGLISIIGTNVANESLTGSMRTTVIYRDVDHMSNRSAIEALL